MHWTARISGNILCIWPCQRSSSVECFAKACSGVQCLFSSSGNVYYDSRLASFGLTYVRDASAIFWMKLVLPAIRARDDLSKHPRRNVTERNVGKSLTIFTLETMPLRCAWIMNASGILRSNNTRLNFSSRIAIAWFSNRTFASRFFSPFSFLSRFFPFLATIGIIGKTGLSAPPAHTSQHIFDMHLSLFFWRVIFILLPPLRA